MQRASSSGLMLSWPLVLRVIHASSKAVSTITRVLGSKEPLPKPCMFSSLTIDVAMMHCSAAQLHLRPRGAVEPRNIGETRARCGRHDDRFREARGLPGRARHPLSGSCEADRLRA